jgi:hypothetical protein
MCVVIGMKTITTFALGLTLASGFLVGCSQETSHEESDSPNWLDNGHTKKETTTYKNADGTESTETSKTRTSN